MSNLIKILASICVVVTIGCATGPSGKAYDFAEGEWNFIWEYISSTYTYKTTIVDETLATYGFRDGRFVFHGNDGQGRWEGYWIEKFGKNNLCADTREGTNAWGEVVLQFNAAYNEFEGTWDFCGEGRKFELRGYR